jgi:TonB family protein
MSQALEVPTGPRGFSLPLVGEDHPLRKRFKKTFIWSFIIAMLLNVVVAGGRLLVVNVLMKKPDSEKVVRFVSIEQVVPPSIAEQEAPPQVNLAAQVAPPSIGVPEPVPDYQAQELTVATVEEMADFQTSDLSALTGGGDSLVVNFDEGLPNPDDYVAVEEMPVLINIPQPTYPDLARDMGTEGTVVLRLLVGKDGKVADVRVVNGPEVLQEAAINAAKQATFKPALQQHRPVAVWVQVPIKFSLQS